MNIKQLKQLIKEEVMKEAKPTTSWNDKQKAKAERDRTKYLKQNPLGGENERSAALDALIAAKRALTAQIQNIETPEEEAVVTATMATIEAAIEEILEMKDSFQPLY